MYLDFFKIHNSFLNLEIRDLTLVNYLVGTSSSGKSLVLEILYQKLNKLTLAEFNKFSNVSFEKSFYSNFKKNTDSETSIKPNFANKKNTDLINTGLYFQNLSNKNTNFTLFINQNTNLIVDLVKKSEFFNLDQTIFWQKLLKNYAYIDWGYLQNILNNNLTTDLDRIFKVKILLSKILKKNPNYRIVLIEEPENFLYPALAKLLPNILQELSDEFQIQFIVATNSPFVALASSNLTEKQKKECELCKKNYFPKQKIYLLNKGQTMNKSGKIGQDKNGYIYGSDGYWGKKAGYVTFNLLGSGISDFLLPTNNLVANDSPILVLCEGQGKDADSKFYNQIFKDLSPRCLFVSCMGNTQTTFSFEILDGIKNGLYANFRILMLRDRDHDFKTLQDIKNFIQKHPNHRILYRRTIECYLFTKEILQNFLKKHNYIISNHYFEKLKKIEKDTQNSVKKGILGSIHKKRFKELYLKILFSINKKYNYNKAYSLFLEELSQQIIPKTQTYKQLKKEIFG